MPRVLLLAATARHAVLGSAPPTVVLQPLLLTRRLIRVWKAPDLPNPLTSSSVDNEVRDLLSGHDPLGFQLRVSFEEVSCSAENAGPKTDLQQNQLVR